ncbi:HAD family phosphatase [Sphingomonas sp. LB-2]|uniref:HAD family hydrolase n=1 Tax=Sphingomonas caeni TaxID=2984949 RepID=UPI0022320E96|nr:HAD family phosphatase [Sphingomonas caeni]MCW3848027.1 HAD family phosphatase [Sphingomonas caeni]
MAELAALLFDLDGTLVDTAEANYRAYAAALAEAGVTIGREQFDAVATGRRWTQFLPLLIPEGHAAIAERKRALYPGLLGASRLNQPLVDLARASRLRLGLVTSASRSGTEAVLAAHGLSGFFEVVITGDDVAEPKPAPDAYRLAAARLGLQPLQCLAFEDSDPGAESARRAGIAVVRIAL